MAKLKWQTVIATSDDHEQPAVRRLSVPGGWLYQVERWAEVDDLDAITRIDWSAPVFVPFHGDGQ